MSTLRSSLSQPFIQPNSSQTRPSNSKTKRSTTIRQDQSHAQQNGSRSQERQVQRDDSLTFGSSAVVNQKKSKRGGDQSYGTIIPINPTIPKPLGSQEYQGTKFNDSTDDDWDMPKAKSEGKGGMELNWQQQATAKIPKPSRRANSTCTKPARRPKIKETISDPTVALIQDSSVPSNLNWQEQLSTSSVSNSNSVSNLRQLQQPLQPASPRTNLPKSKPKSANQSQQKDVETFGQTFSNLSLSFTDDSTRRPKSSGPPTTPSNQSRYAGPTFHNSPDPKTLGIPSFLAKREGGREGRGVFT